jgi:hypothetical protein
MSCRESQNAYFMFHKFFSENFGIYEIMWKRTVQRHRPQITLNYSTSACHAKQLMLQREYVPTIAFPRQQLYHQAVSVFHYSYIARLICENNQQEAHFFSLNSR